MPAMTLDGAAIERLYRSHGHVVLRRARLLLGSEPDAQEALQEVFAALLRAPQDLRRAGSVIGWLYQATTHFCLNQLRNRRTGARILEQSVAPASRTAGGPSPETLSELRSLLARMPADAAAAAVYHHMDGMTHAEVAEMLGCSRRQVGYLLERAQRSLERLEQSA
jgi:RNA polymerase sigma factor (sigma-70 family)